MAGTIDTLIAKLLGAPLPPYAAALTAAVVLLLAFLAYLAWDSGVLLPVRTKLHVLGPFLIVYQDVVGPYMHSGKVQCAILKQLQDLGLVHPSDSSKVSLIGAFFDDPAKVPADKLRHSVGCVYKMGEELTTPEDVEKHRAWLQATTLVKQGELKVGFIPASTCLAASFPFRGALSMITSIVRGYPRLQRALKREVEAGRTTDSITAVVGSLEVYLRSERRMWLSFPLAARAEVRAFDPATTRVNRYTGKGGAGAAGAGSKEE